MFSFLVPLLLGFIFNSASTFTTLYTSRLGAKTARLVCILLRDVLGIPLWALGYIMAARADLAPLFDPGVAGVVAGWLLILTGGVVIGVGLHSLRGRAAAPSVDDSLVNWGIYNRIRHPLYSGMLLELAGLFLIIPTFSMLVACTLGGIWVLIQARLEEADLLQRLPAYRQYMQRVPRFLPRLRLP